MDWDMAYVAPNFIGLSMRHFRRERGADPVLPGDPNLARGATAGSPHPLGGLSKRLLDCAIAGTLLVLTLPLMAIVVGLILVLDGGAPLFAHSRVGYGGRNFACYKFRTMRRDADAILAAHLAARPEAAREWDETRKLRDDPRVTWLGAFLRKSSLDELPQLFNILKGEMSCVGPRPVTRDELLRYDTHVDDYLRSRPGLTGLWQVMGRSGTDFATRVSFDHHYVSTWSFLSDLSILARTPVAVFRGAGAY